MAWTQAQLTSLEAAIALGALEVEYEDRKVKYRSLKEMRSIRDSIRKELGLTTGEGKVVKSRHNKGLDS